MTQTKDSTTGELLPCPFCGDAEPIFVGPPDAPNGKVFVGCETCGGRGAAWGKYEASRKFWNRRAPSRMAASSEERPITPLSPPRDGLELWQEIIASFERYGQPEPPWRLRDELVNTLAWARYGAMLAARPDSGRVDPEAIGDVSSLIAARCSALPGKLIDCPVCGAVDNERERQALVAVPVSEELQPDLIVCPICWGRDDDRQMQCEACGGAGQLGTLEPFPDGLAVPDKGVQGDQGASRSQPCADASALAPSATLRCDDCGGAFQILVGGQCGVCAMVEIEAMEADRDRG